MRYQYLIDTFKTEIEKTLSVWAMFEDEDLHVRPHPTDKRGHNLLEHMIHKSMGENNAFASMLGIKVTDNPLPAEETREAFIRCYAENAARRVAALAAQGEDWWEEVTDFFEVKRSRAWIVTRLIAHFAHHRGQLTCLLRMLNRDLHSTYGPTADTGGLPKNKAKVVYAYPDIETLIAQEQAERRKATLPGAGDQPVTERPD